MVVFMILLIVLLTVSTVNATDIMANNTMENSVVGELDFDNSLKESNIQSACDEVINDDVVQTTNSYHTNKKSVKTIKNDDVLKIGPTTVTVNNATALKDSLESNSIENLIVNLNGDNIYSNKETITVNEGIKNLTINGNYRKIDSNGKYSFLSINHPINLILNNIIVSNCYSEGNGAVICVNTPNSNITIENSAFNENSAVKFIGAVVYQGDASQLRIINSNFTDNQALRFGGAIHQGKNSNLTIVDSKFSNNNLINNNMQMFGGVIYQDENSNLNISNSNFTDNQAETGGAIYQKNNCQLDIVDSRFINNNAMDGGVVYQGNNGVLSINNSLFKENYGIIGGILDQKNNCSITIQESEFISNEVNSGVLSQEKSSNATIINSNFTSNIANSRAGAIYADENAKLTIISSNFTKNQALSGGAILLDGQSKVEIYDSNFKENQAKKYDGGAIYQSPNSELKITNSNFEKNCCINNAGSGGAIFQHQNGNIIINNTSFIENSAAYDGGAISQYNYGTITICDSNFTGNNASEYGGAINNKLAKNLIINDTSFSNGDSKYGGAIYATNNAELNRCNFTGNNASEYGGAISSPLNLAINHCNFLENTARYGGAIADYDGHTTNTGIMEVTDSNFAKNYASVTAATLYVQDFSLVTLNDNVFDSNWVGSSTGWVVRLQENMKVINNLFVNNTDNKRDMLFNILAKEVHDNTYIDNYLNDSWTNIEEPVYMVVNEEYEMFLVELRDVYNNTIVNGTIICYDNSKEIARFDVNNGVAKLKFDSKLHLGLNALKLEYVSLSKHYQDLNRTLNIFLKNGLVSVNVTKNWDDDNNNNRPNNVTIILYNKDTAIEVNRVVLNATNWTYSFKNLDALDSNGNIINYTVDELDVPGYVKTITNNSAYNFTVTNTKVPETIDIKVLVVWDDSNNADGIRPNYVKIQLYADGEVVGEPVIISTTSKTPSLNKNQKKALIASVNRETISAVSTDNQYVFENLPKYKNDKLIKYSIDELDVPTGYTKTITNDNNVFTVTNTHVIEKVNFTVDIVWEGTNNHPNTVKLQLYADDKAVGEQVTLNTDTNPVYVFENLPKNKDGKLIKYTVKLVDVPTGFKESRNESQYRLVIELEKISSKTIFKWSWKLVKIEHKNKHYKNDTKNHNKKYTKRHTILKTQLKTINKLNRKYAKKHNSYTKHKWDKKSDKHKHNSYETVNYKYRLYIYLYSKYMNGSMSYDDFVAILRENNIDITKSNWDKNGVLVMYYNDISEVPDEITLHDKKGDVPDTSVKVNKTKAKKSKNTISEDEADKIKSTDTKGVAISGEVEIELET